MNNNIRISFYFFNTFINSILVIITNKGWCRFPWFKPIQQLSVSLSGEQGITSIEGGRFIRLQYGKPDRGTW